MIDHSNNMTETPSMATAAITSTANVLANPAKTTSATTMKTTTTTATAPITTSTAKNKSGS